MPNHLICILRNLYAGQEATVRSGHRTSDWFKTGKGVHQGCILSPCLFNLSAKSVHFSHSVVSSSLRLHALQHARFSCPSPTPRACSELKSIELVMPSNHLILCCPLLLLPSVFPRIRVFSNESVLLIRWQKFWIFSFSISPSNEYSGLISFKIDGFDLLAVQETLRSLLQHHSSKISFFVAQLSL